MEAILGTVCPQRCATSALVLPNPLFLTRAAGQKDHDMTHYRQLYIDGTWVAPSTRGVREVVDPTTGAVFASVGQGGVADVDLAVAAARRALASYAQTTVADRVALIDSIIAAYKARARDFAEVIARGVGIPISSTAQLNGPVGHMEVARDLLKSYAFEQRIGDTIIRREPIRLPGWTRRSWSC